MSADWIALDWDLPHLKLLLARRDGARWEIRSQQTFTVPEALCVPGQGRHLGEWLRAEWELLRKTDENSPSFSLCVVLPRDRVTIRRLDLPPIPDEELAGLVPLQMASLLTARMEDLVVDFLPLENFSEQPGRAVSAAAIPTVLYQDLQGVAHSIHGDLHFVGTSSCCWQSLVSTAARADSSSTTVLYSCCTAGRLETLLVENSFLINSGCRRRNSAAPLTPREPAAEIRRLLSTEQGLSETPPQQALLLTSENVLPVNSAQAITFQQELTQTLSFPVFWFDPDPILPRIHFPQLSPETGWEQLQSEGYLTCLSGLWAAQQSTVAQINFQNPRKSIEAKDRRKERIIAASVAAVLLLGTAWWLWASQLSSLDAEIETLRHSLADSDKFLKNKGIVVKHANSLEDYQARSLRMTTHAAELLRALPDRDQLVLSQWRAVPVTGDSQTRVLTSGYATTRQSIEQLAEKLDHEGMLVRSPTIRAIENRAPYTFEFDLEYEIPVVNKKQTARLQAEKTASVSPAS